MVDSVAIVQDTASVWDVGSFNSLNCWKNYLARDRSSSAARRLNVECNSEMWREKCMDGNIAAFISPRKQGGSPIRFLCKSRANMEQSVRQLRHSHSTY
jgi:hypothetical protein